MSTNKRILYVGGLSDEVDEKTVHAAFVPFGDIIDVNMPIDFTTQKHRGFAFIEFESAEDAADAIDNMNESEIFGKTIRVNIAKPIKLKEGSARPVWADDSWLQQHAGTTLSGQNFGVTASNQTEQQEETGEETEQRGEKREADSTVDDEAEDNIHKLINSTSNIRSFKM